MRRDASELHGLVAQRLEVTGLLYTKGRRQLVEMLAELGRPVTMADLVDLRPRLAQSSLYRNMIDLEAAGIVQKVASPDDRTRFELAEELIGHHHHSLCTRCGAVDDFVVPTGAERTLEAALVKALSESGFQPTGHRLDVIGLCADCA